MSNLTSHAKRELEIIGAFDKDGSYDGLIGEAVMELLEVFAKQGHSGYSAGLVRNLFNKVADFKPLSPLRFTDDEWNESLGNDEETYQNNRNSAVFKNGKDGRPRYGNAYVCHNEEVGSWNSSLLLACGKWVRSCYIKDPSNLPTVQIELPITRHSDEGGDWDFDPAPLSVLSELEEFYDVELIDVKETKENRV